MQDELERFYRHIGLFSVSASLSGLLFSHSSLSLPRDCLSFGGKWKHKQAESALWFLLLLLKPPRSSPPRFPLHALAPAVSLSLHRHIPPLLSSTLLSSFSEASQSRVTVTSVNTAPKWRMIRIAPPPCRKLSSINTGLRSTVVNTDHRLYEDMFIFSDYCPFIPLLFYLVFTQNASAQIQL